MMIMMIMIIKMILMTSFRHCVYFLFKISHYKQALSSFCKSHISWLSTNKFWFPTGCYAPNGFHSEKPVICGLAVDNRILTLYKEENINTRTELEDVEVKLFPVGMLVYGVHSKTHWYDTDQMWAAFYKMLLLKRLVPKIFLTNHSPGFDWIKRFVNSGQ